MRPTGTVTFLFTDIEGSTRLLADVGDERYGALLEQHRALLRDACARHGGYDFGGAGDLMFVAFNNAHQAVRAAFAAPCALIDHPWPDDRTVRVRMGLHTCETTTVADDYVGIGVHRASRICDAAHGSQVLLSATVHALMAENSEFAVRDMGEHLLKSFSHSERVYQLLHPRLPADFPPLRTGGKRPNNLPPQLTSTVGREHEIEAIAAALRAARASIVTLTGAGGTGKTRLAVQTAAHVADEYADGVFFVSLAAITDPSLVLPSIAHAIGVSAAAGQSLTAYLAEKRMLVVLDNLEQVIGCAPEIGALVAHAAGVKLLVTSREPLHVIGEQIYPVP